MKRANRLRKPDQFHRARREGRSWSSPQLTITIANNKRRGTRCGFVVGKRIGNAVERNRARRRLREAVRLVFDRITPGWDLVVVARTPAILTLAFTELQAIIEQLLRRAGIWRELRATNDEHKG